jgi:hypothetical protein
MIATVPIVGIKKETMHNVKETLAPSDFIFPINDSLDMSIAIEHYAPAEYYGVYSKSVGIAGKRSASLKFDVYLSYTNANIIPSWFLLFELCGWRINYNYASTDEWVAIMDTVDSVVIDESTDMDTHVLQTVAMIDMQSHHGTTSATIEVVYPNEIFDKQVVYTLTGCMGTAKIIGKAGEPVKVEFVFVGSLYSIDTVTELKSIGVMDATLPRATLSSTMQLSGVDVACSAFELSIGTMQSLYSDISSISGYAGCYVTDSYSSGVIDIDEPVTTVVSKHTKQINNATDYLYFTLGNLFIYCTVVQYTSVEPNKLIFDVHESVRVGIG